MPAPVTLHDLAPQLLMQDVYFRDDFLALHAPGRVTSLGRSDFRHAAAVVDIPGSERCDLETPWGYGGPAALDAAALASGLADWRGKQQAEGRVAEFIRLHPFINPVPLSDRLDMLTFNRPTVLVDLDRPEAARWNFYSDSTRNCVRKAQRELTLRPLTADEWPLFRELYERGLRRNEALPSYFLSEAYYRGLLSAAWCSAWLAEDRDGPLAVSCFLHSGTPLCHYHLAGGDGRSRQKNALYLLLHEAFRHFRKVGCRWLHMGGGRTASDDDQLLAFKSKFSPERAHYYIGGLIFDPAAYRGLGGGRRGRFLCSGSDAPATPSATGAESSVSLRRFIPGTDFPSYFRLRCDPANAVWTGFDRPPSWSWLKDWVERELKSGLRRIFMIDVAGQAAGYAYAIHGCQGIETAIGVARDASGRGTARAALRQLVDCLRKDQNWQPPYAAWIYPDNAASIRAYEAAGFRPDPSGMTRLIGRKQMRWIWTADVAASAEDLNSGLPPQSGSAP